MQDVLKEVEVQEPRFISSLTEINGRYEGFDVVSPNEFEVVLYLNQMGVFNFVDDGSLPGMITLETWAECQARPGLCEYCIMAPSRVHATHSPPFKPKFWGMA